MALKTRMTEPDDSQGINTERSYCISFSEMQFKLSSNWFQIHNNWATDKANVGF